MGAQKVEFKVEVKNEELKLWDWKQFFNLLPY